MPFLQATVYRYGGNHFRGFQDTPLSKWFAAIYLMCASKKGISAHQLQRQLDITYKSAWFMCHRVREAMSGNGTFQLLKRYY